MSLKESTFEGTPSFELLGSKSNSTDPRKNIPQFSIVFPNGDSTTTNLSYYDPFSNLSTKNRSKACNYIGNLNDDPGGSIIATTGCLQLLGGIQESNNSENGTETHIFITMF